MNSRNSTIWWTLPLAVIALACLLAMGPRVRGIALATFYLAGAATALAMVPGVLAAVVLTKTNCPLRRWMLAAFAVLLFVPLFVHAGGWMGALGVGGWLVPTDESGQTRPWIDGWPGAIWVHAMAAVPWVVCIVSAALVRVPAELEETALLSMPAWRVLRTVTLRAALPGIAIAAVWTAVSVAAEMTVTDFFQIRTFAEEVYTTAASGAFPTDQVDGKDTLLDEAATAWNHYAGLIGGVVLLAVLMLWVLAPVVSSFAAHADASTERLWRWRLRGGRWLLAIVPASVLLLVAALPIAALVYKAGLGAVETSDGWQRVWQLGKLTTELTGAAGHHWRELLQTLGLGAAVATTATIVGALFGWRLRICRGTPWAMLALFALAMSIPGPILGLVAIKLLNHPLDSPLAWLTWAYDRTLLAPWLVQTIRFTPVAALIMAAGFASVPRSLIDAAQTDGAGWFARFWRIGLLQVLPQVLSTWLATFALSAGELSASVLVMPPGPPTLTIRLFGLLHYGVEDRVSAMSLVLLATVSLVAAAAVWLVGYGRREHTGRV
ncbi:ABC transporter permease [Aeoliella sp.]|uniref:ABC transporter permease n=1 Tax=Aeoliella sp. TaxID=2795800 RepID=UPI003CCBED96